MIRQLSLDGEPSVIGDDAAGREAQRLVLKRIVARLGGKVAEAACDLDETHISKALSENPAGRFLKREHIDALLKLSTPTERSDYFAASMQAYGLTPVPVRMRSIEERLRDLEEAVIRQFGKSGGDLVDAERAKP